MIPATPLDKTAWNTFVARQPHAPFLQSWEWGEFQESQGHTVVRLLEKEDTAIKGCASVILKKIGGKFRYAVIPRGPCGLPPSREVLERVLHECTPALFVRCEPASLEALNSETPASGTSLSSTEVLLQENPALWPDERTNIYVGGADTLCIEPARIPCGLAAGSGSFAAKKVPSGGFRNSELKGVHPSLRRTIDIHPSHTLLLDLSQPLDTLMGAMESKTRYNIRLAEKRGVQVRSTAEGSEEFVELLQTTAQRGHFSIHPGRYYRDLLNFFGTTSEGANKPFARLYTAYHEEKFLAAALVIFFGDTATYLHGASSNQDRNMMAPSLVHFQVMKDAQAQGYRWYDFWGIAPLGQPKHPWAGITRFKTGFGGIRLDLPGTFDYTMHPFQYQCYKLLRWIRRSI